MQYNVDSDKIEVDTRTEEQNQQTWKNRLIKAKSDAKKGKFKEYSRSLTDMNLSWRGGTKYDANEIILELYEVNKWGQSIIEYERVLQSNEAHKKDNEFAEQYGINARMPIYTVPPKPSPNPPATPKLDEVIRNIKVYF